jgi:hypothetical protein
VVLIPGERLRRQRIGPHFLVFILQLRQPAFESGRVVVRASNDGEYRSGDAILLTLGVNLGADERRAASADRMLLCSSLVSRGLAASACKRSAV